MRLVDPKNDVAEGTNFWQWGPQRVILVSGKHKCYDCLDVKSLSAQAS